MKLLPLRRLALASAAFLALAASGSAHAVFRAYLSVNGTDTNNTLCSVQAPCRLLPAALAAVDSGGEIWMLDSANFNTSVVSVTKSVTILAIPGQKGSLVGLNGTAIAIGGANIKVTLQNLNILNFNHSGDIGILVNDAAVVNVIGCNVFGFDKVGGLGIWVATGANATKVNIVDSIVRNNHHGIVAAGNAHVTVSNTQILGNNAVGLWANAGTGFVVNVHVNDTVSSGNLHGFAVTGSSGAFNSLMFVTRSVATENVNAGFLTEGGITAFLAVGESFATGNNVGFSNGTGSGSFQSRGNNTVTGNFTNTLNTITFMPGT